MDILRDIILSLTNHIFWDLKRSFHVSIDKNYHGKNRKAVK